MLLPSSLASGSITKSARWSSQEWLELIIASIANVLLQHIHVCAASCNILVCAYASTNCICNTALSAVHHRSILWPCMLNGFITQSREHQVLTVFSSELRQQQSTDMCIEMLPRSSELGRHLIVVSSSWRRSAKDINPHEDGLLKS